MRKEYEPTILARARHYWPIFLGLGLIFIVAIGVHATLQRLESYQGETDAILFTTLLVFTLVGWLTLSGRLVEFTGPGGWGFKLRKAMSAQPQHTTVRDYTQQLQAIVKNKTTDIAQALPLVEKGEVPVLLIEISPQEEDYEELPLEKCLSLLISRNVDAVVIFQNQHGQFIGSINAIQLRSLMFEGLEDLGPQTRFMKEINQTVPPPRLSTVPAITTTLRENETRKSALEKFWDTGAHALVVVDEIRTPKGVVLRDRLVSELLLEITDPSDAAA